MSQVIMNKQQLLMISLTNFFKIEENMIKFLDILSNPRISLRVIDWSVTNFFKNKDIINKSNDSERIYFIHDSYKAQLKAYSKKQFDPFQRRTRINFHYAPDKKMVTTVGQLNFFKWFIEGNVLDIISENLEQIETNMRTYVKESKKCKKNKKTKSKETTSIVAIQEENALVVEKAISDLQTEEKKDISSSINTRNRRRDNNCRSFSKHSNVKVVLNFQ